MGTPLPPPIRQRPRAQQDAAKDGARSPLTTGAQSPPPTGLNAGRHPAPARLTPSVAGGPRISARRLPDGNQIDDARLRLLMEQEADIRARSVCNTLKALAPLFSAVLSREHAALNDAEALVLLQQACERITLRVTRNIGFKPGDDPPAKTARLVYITCARALGRVWREDGTVNTATEDRLVSVFTQVARSSSHLPKMELDYTPTELATTVTMLHALLPVTAAHSRDSFSLPKGRAYRYAAETIANSALHFGEQVAGAAAGSRTLGFVTQALLTHGGELYGAAWKRVSHRIRGGDEATSRLPDSDPRACTSLDAEDLLNAVDREFNISMAALVEAAEVGLVLDQAITARSDHDAIPRAERTPLPRAGGRP